MKNCRSNGINWGAVAGEIRRSVSAREIAGYFGLTTDEHGFARCPFHTDKKPSLKLYGENRGFYCFACKKSGSVIDLAAQITGTGPRDAMRLIDSAFGLNLLDADTTELTRRREDYLAKKREKKQRVTDAQKAYDDAVRAERACMESLGAQRDDDAFFAGIAKLAAARNRADARFDEMCEAMQVYRNGG